MTTNKDRNNPVVMAIDPALRNVGWLISELNRGKWAVKKHGLIVTKKAPVKLKIRKAIDDLDAVESIASKLIKLIADNNVSVLLIEIPAGSKNARAAKAAGIVLGILGTILNLTPISAEWFSAREVKKAFTGDVNASKADMELKMGSKYPEVAKCYLSDKSGKTYVDKFEHVADAGGVLEAAIKTGSTLQLFEKIYGGR